MFFISFSEGKSFIQQTFIRYLFGPGIIGGSEEPQNEYNLVCLRVAYHPKRRQTLQIIGVKNTMVGWVQ